MECVIVQRLPHTRLPAMIQAQKQALDSRIRQYSRSHVVHDGLSAFQEGHRRVEIGSIPGEKQTTAKEASINQSINPFAFVFFRTHPGGQQTISMHILQCLVGVTYWLLA